mmetsp:Transcript_10694/g.25331  ORF Transcript_10694/g.25331 Transcript_10694/m.25331 type:complete len:254 (-) Transcript_10694:3278-4039(-)
MKLISSFATTVFLGLSKQSFGFVSTSRSISRHYLTKNSGSFLRMSTSTDTTTPDVSKFMAGERPEGTKDYVMQQTMIRVKDPIKSLEFYCDVLGFKLIMYREFPQWGFNVYFIAPVDAVNIPEDKDAQWEYCMKTPGCIELTYNYGSEKEEGLVYNTGNADTTGVSNGESVKGGFGHLGITVPDVYEACERFKKLGCEFKKTPNAGGMKGLAFVKDPDGYLVEVLPQGPMISKPLDCDGVPAEGGEGYKDNSK